MIINENQNNNRSSHDRRTITGYQNYLTNHINNVKKAYEMYIKPVLISNYDMTNEQMHVIEDEISNHDKSKWLEEEYEPYALNFYPPKGHNSEEFEREYDEAWLHHQHNNRHHWQYWVLIRDSSETVPLDMPFSCIIGMLADWSSFQFIRNNSSAHKWYNDMGDSMILSENTRKIVEDLLKNCPEL